MQLFSTVKKVNRIFSKKQRRQVLLITTPIYNHNHVLDILKEDMILKERNADKTDELRDIVDTIFDANFTTVEEGNRKFSQYDAQITPMVTKDYLDDEDGYDGIAFNRFIADCARKGVTIKWEKMI